MNKQLVLAAAMIGLSTIVLADIESGTSSSTSESTASYAQTLPDSIPKLVDAQDYSAAIDALNDFIKEESRNADAWNLLGYSLRKTEQYDESLKAYKKALKLDRKHLGAREYLGELYLALGKPKKAQKQLNKLEEYCGDCSQYVKLTEAIQKFEAGS